MEQNRKQTHSRTVDRNGNHKQNVINKFVYALDLYSLIHPHSPSRLHMICLTRLRSADTLLHETGTMTPAQSVYMERWRYWLCITLYLMLYERKKESTAALAANR